MFFHIICRVCAILPVAKSVSSIQTAVMHPTSLLFTLASLFLFHQRVHAECKPVACGNFTIKYPFWLGAPRQDQG